MCVCVRALVRVLGYSFRSLVFHKTFPVLRVLNNGKFLNFHDVTQKAHVHEIPLTPRQLLVALDFTGMHFLRGRTQYVLNWLFTHEICLATAVLSLCCSQLPFEIQMNRAKLIYKITRKGDTAKHDNTEHTAHIIRLKRQWGEAFVAASFSTKYFNRK